MSRDPFGPSRLVPVPSPWRRAPRPLDGALARPRTPAEVRPALWPQLWPEAEAALVPGRALPRHAERRPWL